MNTKRITILSGHYGSGKTNIAVNLALDLRKQHSKVAIADIDIVNPYFRTKDSEEMLQKADIRLICSPYANSNVDIPALPQEIYSITDNRDVHCVLDVGGDERGALALGRISPKIKEENDFDMFAVLNCYRPLTRDADSAIGILREIEAACGLKFTALINNSNLGRETTAQDVLDSVPLAEQIAKQCGLPIIMTTVEESLYDSLSGKIDNLYPLSLQKKL